MIDWALQSQAGERIWGYIGEGISGRGKPLRSSILDLQQSFDFPDMSREFAAVLRAFDIYDIAAALPSGNRGDSRSGSPSR